MRGSSLWRRPLARCSSMEVGVELSPARKPTIPYSRLSVEGPADVTDAVNSDRHGLRVVSPPAKPEPETAASPTSPVEKETACIEMSMREAWSDRIKLNKLIFMFRTGPSDSLLMNLVMFASREEPMTYFIAAVCCAVIRKAGKNPAKITHSGRSITHFIGGDPVLEALINAARSDRSPMAAARTTESRRPTRLHTASH